MDLDLGPDLESFRISVRETISRSLPDDIRERARRGFTSLPASFTRRWTRILSDLGGWSVPNWPVHYGGPGWDLRQQYVFERELALAGAPRLQVFGQGMLGPAIIEFGSEEMKRAFLPGVRNGDLILCQGYSEPNAGSDLAALQCRALRRGDEYVVNGTKIWTSGAHVADWMFGLFRTDSSGRKQEGITFLLIDMRSPGISIQPILGYDDLREVNQVFFDNVVVPAANRLGEENKGWGIAKLILTYERFGTAEIGHSLFNLERLKKLAGAGPAGPAPLIEDRAFAEAIARVEIDLWALEFTERRILLADGGANNVGPEASLLKICGTEIQNRILELTVQALGPLAPVCSPDEELEASGEVGVPAGFEWATQLYFNMRKTLIYSGSNEIQKNIIARSVLGLRS